MKRNLLYGCTLSLFLSASCLQAQTQIGSDIKGNTGDYLGSAIALSSNGDIMAIGYPKSNTYGSGVGKVKIFENIGGTTWTQIGPDIKPADNYAPYKFGTSIALSADGSTLAIGVPYFSGKNWEKDFAGGVQILKKNINGDWTEIGYILGEDAHDNSGDAIALSADGNTIAIGAQFNKGGGIGDSTGQIRVFHNDGGTWTKIGSDIDGEASHNNFGRSIAISADGSVVAAGAPFNSNDNGAETGNVRVFKNINNDWTKIGTSILGQPTDYMFGISLSLSEDGNTIAIGDNRNSDTDPDDGIDDFNIGHTRIYQNMNGEWSQIGHDIKGDYATEGSSDSVSLSSDGTVVAIGASHNNNNYGQIRIYQYLSDEWEKRGNGINGKFAGEMFGSWVALSKNGKVVAGGAPYNSENGQFTYNGKVRAFDISSVLATDSFVSNNSTIYPNPTKNQLNIMLQQDLVLEKVTIYNTLGQLIRTENNNNVINVSSLSSGVYFVEVFTNKGKATKKIVVE